MKTSQLPQPTCSWKWHLDTCQLGNLTNENKERMMIVMMFMITGDNNPAWVPRLEPSHRQSQIRGGCGKSFSTGWSRSKSFSKLTRRNPGSWASENLRPGANLHKCKHRYFDSISVLFWNPNGSKEHLQNESRPRNQWWCCQGSSGSTARSHWVHGETLTTSTCSSKYEAGFHTCGHKHFYLFSGSRLGRLWTIWNRTTMNLWRGWDCDFFHGLTETLAGDEQAGGENGAEQSSLCRRDPRRRQGLQAEDGRAGQNKHY